MSVRATEKYRMVTPHKPYYPPLQDAGYGNVDAVARGQMKSPSQPPILGQFIKDSIEVTNDTNLGIRQVGYLVDPHGGGNLAYQGTALGSVALNSILSGVGMRDSYHRAKISDRIGDKYGSFEGRFSFVKYAILFGSAVGYLITRILNIKCAVLGVDVAMNAPTLLGRVAFGFGLASGILILAYTVGSAALAASRIYKRNRFLTKLDYTYDKKLPWYQRVYHRSTTNEQINYLRSRVLVFSEPYLPVEEALKSHMALAANGGSRALFAGQQHDIIAHTADESVAKYDLKYNPVTGVSPAELIPLGRAWARENLRLAIESFPNELAEIKDASDEELDQLLDHFFSLKATAEGRPFGERAKGTHYAELGRIAFFTRLEQKKDAKMMRILGMNQTELQQLKMDLANPNLTQIEKEGIINRIHGNIKKNNLFDGLIIGAMVLGIIAIIVGMVCTGGIGAIIATALTFAFALSVLALDGYSFYQSYKSGDVGKHDELVAKISIAVAAITFTIAIVLLTTVSFGVVPLVVVSVLTVAWITFKVTTWYLARKIRLEKEAAAVIHGPPVPPVGNRGVAQMTQEAQRNVYNLYMRHKHHHAI